MYTMFKDKIFLVQVNNFEKVPFIQYFNKVDWLLGSIICHMDYGHPERAFFKNPKILGLGRQITPEYDISREEFCK